MLAMAVLGAAALVGRARPSLEVIAVLACAGGAVADYLSSVLVHTITAERRNAPGRAHNGRRRMTVLTEAEHELLELLRDPAPRNFTVTIAAEDGHWHVRAEHHEDGLMATGQGTTFERAWQDLSPGPTATTTLAVPAAAEKG
jgi:hypothetical protein